MSLALLALAAIRVGSTLWKPLTWLFVLATVADLGNALVVGPREDLFARASGVACGQGRVFNHGATYDTAAKAPATKLADIGTQR